MSDGLIALIVVLIGMPLVIFLVIFIPIRIHVVRKRKRPDQKLELKKKELRLKEEELSRRKK